ncbi:uncharacterized protein N7525_006858 [Penicillium rubens]|uniref:uncharacterized protein n=1 Tax=Penicillium rubens TaxID=1108849 RepID=UPI002A5A8553|nr:uncharacterized protein N7525_006858 [Penicillium rubens]KAJ5828605.1 hypothetical protein N7525_006858 [Penicillium rubens]
MASSLYEPDQLAYYRAGSDALARSARFEDSQPRTDISNTFSDTVKLELTACLARNVGIVRPP